MIINVDIILPRTSRGLPYPDLRLVTFPSQLPSYPLHSKKFRDLKNNQSLLHVGTDFEKQQEAPCSAYSVGLGILCDHSYFENTLFSLC